jgi:hypothetical protein
MNLLLSLQCSEKVKICHSEPRLVFDGVRNLLFPWPFCEQQILHPQTTRVRDNKRRLSAAYSCVAGAYRLFKSARHQAATTGRRSLIAGG